MKKRVVHTSARSLKRCRKLGWIADKVERWIPMRGHPAGGQRKDFLGAFDILALTCSHGETCCHVPETVAIQSCAMSGRAAHLAKLRAEPVAARVRAWLRPYGHRAELWAWRKLKAKRGGKAVRWAVDVTPLDGGSR